MKKERTIIIKNPILRNLRDNLRKIWIRAIWREVDRLEEKRNEYPTLSKATSSERKEILEIKATIQDLNELELNSIAYCQLCTSFKNDMVYIPENKAWYCTECQKKGVIVRLKDPREDHIVP
jgi:DNA-directed RNA polymerase specialized sigma subunit